MLHNVNVITQNMQFCKINLAPKKALHFIAKKSIILKPEPKHPEADDFNYKKEMEEVTKRLREKTDPSKLGYSTGLSR